MKLLPEQQGVLSAVQGAVLLQVWLAAPLLLKFWPWDPLLSLQEGLGVVAVDPGPTLVAYSATWA